MSIWRLKVRVTPRASRNEIEGWDCEVLRVRVTAPPADGQANEACRELLAKALGVARGRVILAQGARSREKVFEIQDADPQMQEKLSRK